MYYYEIDINGNKIRPLPGYHDRYRSDLLEVDKSLWSETQADYMAIDPELIVEVSDVEHGMLCAKTQKRSQIKASFEDALQNGVFHSTVLGIDCDCRRSSTNNDKQNVEGLISYMQRNGLTETQYRGYADTVTVTPADLTALISEMEDHVLGLYQHKWSLEEAVDTGTPAEIENITW